MTEPRTCWSCTEPIAEGANWCEACGASATPPPDPCVSCGADGNDIADGYCGTCGHKQPHPRDHIELDLGSVAGVSDKGKRHHHNEDSMAVHAGETGTVLVVCDGVSSTRAPETASQAAADTAAAVLQQALTAGTEPVAALIDAAAQAQQAVLDAPATQGRGDPPSCTFVAAVAPADGSGAVAVGWLGDSRAYLVSDGVATQLTTDDSWAREQIASGALDADAAQADPRAHSITRWLGEDAIDVEPRTAVIDAAQGDVLLVCTDGLWNYAPTETAMGELVSAGNGTSPIEQAHELVEFALAQGGHDNITVAMAKL